MAEKVDEAGIVWIAPELILRERRAEVVKRHRGSSEALIEKLDELDDTVTGEYRRIVDFENDDPALGSATRVEGAVAVEDHEDQLYVWIDDAQDDPTDPAGHYEPYDPEEHGEPYAPIPSRRGLPAQEAPRVSEEEE